MKERYLTKRHDDDDDNDDDDDDFMTVFFSDCCEPNLHVLFMLARNGKRPGLSLTHVFPLFQKSAKPSGSLSLVLASQTICDDQE
jgi:hypothetical protein